MQLTGGAVRKLIPAATVAAVLVTSFLAQPSLASSTNNCGVKGYGYHDHGKPCPNRPFPGHGKGVIRIAAQFGTPIAVAANPGDGHEKPAVTVGAPGTTSAGESSTSASKSHGHGRDKSNSKGLGRSIF